MSGAVEVVRTFLKWAGDKSFEGTRTRFVFTMIDTWRDRGLPVYLDMIVTEARESPRHKWRTDGVVYTRLPSRSYVGVLSEADAIKFVPTEIVEEALKQFRERVAFRPWSKP